MRATHTKKGRRESGLVLVEGQHLVKEAGRSLLFSFTPYDTPNFQKLVTTETPQEIAGVARLPVWTKKDVEAKNTLVVLDHVQDPGNLGTIFRSALAFNAALLLVECADSGNPKVIRSSAGALFHVPWMEKTCEEALALLPHLKRPLYRLEITPGAMDIKSLPGDSIAVIAGSEGQGILLPVSAPSVKISHERTLESLNVAVAVSLLLHARY